MYVINYNTLIKLTAIYIIFHKVFIIYLRFIHITVV